MKKLVIAILVLVAFLSCSKSKSSLPSGSPKEVLSNDLFAQLSAKYDSIADFEFGYAVVKKGKYGLLDYKGQEVLGCVYDTIFAINPDAKVLEQNGKFGVVGYNGNKITELENDEIKFKPDCTDTKIVALKKGKLWGIINLQGNIIIPFEYDDIASIDTHNAVIGKNGKYGIVDSVGNFSVELKYDTIYYHFEESNISLVELNRCIGLVNSQNKVVTNCDFNCEYLTFRSMGGRIPRIEAPKNGYIRFEKFQADANKSKLYGLVECETGKVAIPFEYDDMGDYSEGLIWAEKDNKCGYLDITNRVIIQFKYGKAYNFSEGLAAVGERDGYYNAVMGRVPNFKIGFIDKNGNVVIPFQFQPQFASTTPEFREGLSPMGVSPNNYWGLNIGYINKKGEFVIKPIYDEAEPFENGLGKVGRNKKVGYVNSTGEEVIPVEYEYVCFENDSLVYCSNWNDGTTDYYTNKQGKVQKMTER